MTRYLLAATACLALAACGGKKDEAPVTEDTTAATTVDTGATPMASGTATGSMTGTYEVKMADGTTTIQTVNADGTYVDKSADGTETERGTWRQNGSQMCFDPAGAPPEACYAGGAAGADGSFEIRDASGNVVSTARKTG